MAVPDLWCPPQLPKVPSIIPYPASEQQAGGARAVMCLGTAEIALEVCGKDESGSPRQVCVTAPAGLESLCLPVPAPEKIFQSGDQLDEELTTRSH